MDRLPAEAEQLCNASPYDFSDLRALFINCTLKRSPEVSNTAGPRRPLDGRSCAATASRSTRSAPSTTTSPPASGRT